MAGDEKRRLVRDGLLAADAHWNLEFTTAVGHGAHDISEAQVVPGIQHAEEVDGGEPPGDEGAKEPRREARVRKPKSPRHDAAHAADRHPESTRDQGTND